MSDQDPAFKKDKDIIHILDSFKLGWRERIWQGGKFLARRLNKGFLNWKTLLLVALMALLVLGVVVSSFIPVLFVIGVLAVWATVQGILIGWRR